MSTRVSEEEVKAIIDTTVTTEGVTPFLRTANVLVTEVIGTDADYTTDLAREIELWLAAHLVALRDPRVKSEKLGDGAATYHGESGVGLRHTPYGQQVLAMDLFGKFADLDAGRVISAELKAIA